MRVQLGHSPPFSFQKLMHGDFHGLIGILHGGIHVLIGMTILGIVLGTISYFIVHYFYDKEKKRRLTRARNKHAIRANRMNRDLI
jgi:uncharacterized protein (DUF2062 family)